MHLCVGGCVQQIVPSLKQKHLLLFFFSVSITYRFQKQKKEKNKKDNKQVVLFLSTKLLQLCLRHIF